MAIIDRIQAVVSDKLGVDVSEVVPDAKFTDDLNADSLDLVDLIMAIEEEFSTDDVTVEISDEDAEGITTVRAAVDYLTEHGISND